MTKKNSSVQLVYNKIKEMIAERELLPGERIIEMDIAAQLGCSRTPVREALQVLQKEGLVDIVPNRGAFLKKLTKADVIKGFEAAEALEGMACYLVAERVRKGELAPADFDNLRECAEEMNQFLADGQLKKWASADAKFHEMLTELSDNHYIIQERNRILEQVNQVLWFVTLSDIDKDISNREHMEMLAIFQAGETEPARTIGQIHRHRIRDELMVLL